MLDGLKLWEENTGKKLQKVKYKGKEMYAYRNLPASMYEDLVCSAGKYAYRTAVVTDEGVEYTYGEFLKAVDMTAAYLKNDKKVCRGDKVVLMLFNTVEFCVLVYAVSKIGGIIVPVSTKLKPYEWKTLLKKIEFKLIFLDKRLEKYKEDIKNSCAGAEVLGDVTLAELAGNADVGRCLREETDNADARQCVCEKTGNTDTRRCVREEIGWEDNAVLMFTSGTTAESKGVVLSNFNVLNAIFSYEDILALTEEDKTVIATPIYHIIGVVSLLGVFIHCGGTVYLHMSFNAGRVLETVRDKGITFLHSTPTVFVMLLEKQNEYQKLPSLRVCLCGSANTPPEMAVRLHRWLPEMEFCPVYGMTESSSVGAVFSRGPAGKKKAGSSGRPVPGMYMKTVTDEGEECPEGEPGELMLRGCFMMDNYLGEEDPLPGGEKWFRTGDIAALDKDGYVYIVDRKKDMISRGGEKIWSNEVENVLYRMEQVQTAALIGVPDGKYGEVAVAVIKAKGSLSEENVKDWVGRHLAKYKVPAKVIFTEEFPRTMSGKISKKRLREQYRNLMER